LGFTGAYTTQTTKTSTGTATKTLNAAEEWWAMTVALAPYVAPGGTTIPVFYHHYQQQGIA
jgi:hypothetical protein